MAMNSGSKMTNVLLVLLSASVLATVCTIMYHFVDTSYETETAIRATADESQIFDGVYVRDETVVSYTGDGAVSYQIPDGGKAAVGDAIAQIYADETAIETHQQIEELEKKLAVLERISNVGALEQAQPETLSRQFTEYYKDIVFHKDQGDFSAVSEDEQSFLEAYSTFQIVISGGEVSFSDQIAELTAEIASLNAQSSAPIDEIKAESASYFVSHVDGYESVLTVDGIDDITPQLIAQVIANDTENTEGNGAIGKMIAAYDWYMVGMIDNQDLKYQVGDMVTLRILTSSAQAQATIEEIRTVEGTDEVMVVLHSENMTSDFVQNRCEHVEMVLGEYEGIKVPREAIRFQDVPVVDEETGEETGEVENCRGVLIEDGEEVVFRRLDVIYEGNDYVLSNLNAGEGYLKLYDSIIVEGIDANGN